MAKFSYSVRDAENRLLTGQQEAQNADEALRLLTDRGLRVTDIEELNFDGTRKNATYGEKVSQRLSHVSHRVPYKEVVFFTRQLATMVEAGVPLARALEQLAKGASTEFAKVVLQVAEDISVGNTFSEALARHPGAFDNMYVSVVRAGEVSGSLDRVLDQVATYMENMEARKQKIKGAMRYPTFIAGFITVIVIGILWKLVPVFEGLYGSAGAELPKPTRMLIFLSHIIQDHFVIVFLCFLTLGLAYWLALSMQRFRFLVDKHLLRVPIFGILLRKSIWATFCRTMALLMESGTPILQAIEIAAAVVGNLRFVQALEGVHSDLKGGVILSSALENSQVFPVLVVQLAATGEESGRVDELLVKAADFYDREITITVDSLSTIIEPILIVVIGTIVGFILISLYLPVFNVGKLMQ